MSKVVAYSSPLQISCPACRTVLRLRRLPADAAEFDCPDCRKPLELFQEGDEVRLRVVAPAVKPKTVRKQASVIPSVSFSRLNAISRPRRSRAAAAIGHWATDPLLIMWIVAGVAAIGLGIAFWRTHESSTNIAKRSVAAVDDAANARNESRESINTTKTTSVLPAEPVEAPRRFFALRQPVEAARPPATPPPDPKRAIADALSGNVLRFDQLTPVAFDLLRFQLEELTGVAIRYDSSVDAGVREQAVTVASETATLGETLAVIADKVGLKPVIEDDGIVLVPDTGESEPKSAFDDEETVGP